MKDKAFRKGLSIAAIVLTAISCLILSFSDANEKLFGKETALFNLPFIAAFAIPLLAILIILTRFYNNTDTMEEMIGAVAVRYSIFGWCFVFLMRFADSLLKIFCLDFYSKNSGLITLLMNSFNVCVVGTAVLAIVLRTLPAVKIEKRTIKFKQLFLLIMMMYGIAQIGAMMGAPIETILSIPSVFASSSEELMNNLQNNVLLSPNLFVRIITIGILPAVFEELLFRKFMIDRTIRYGEFVSCAMSGIMFGLWHGNFQQFFYAFFIGVLFSFVYIRTGHVIYTMILHASMNVVTSSVTTELLRELLERSGITFSNGSVNTNVDEMALLQSILPVIMLILLWVFILLGFQIAGFVLFIVKRKNFKLIAMEGEPGRKVILHKMTRSVAMWIFFTLAILRFVEYYFPDFLVAFFR